MRRSLVIALCLISMSAFAKGGGGGGHGSGGGHASSSGHASAAAHTAARPAAHAVTEPATPIRTYSSVFIGGHVSCSDDRRKKGVC